MTKQTVSAGVVVNTIITQACTLAKLQTEGLSISQQMAALIKQAGIKARDDKAYTPFRKSMRDKLAARIDVRNDKGVVIDEVTAKLASRTLDAQLSYGMNIVTGTNRGGDKCDKNGRVIKKAPGPVQKGKKAADKEVKKESDAVVVNADSIMTYFGAALGDEGAYCIKYIMEHKASMLPKLITMVKFDFESNRPKIKVA